MRVAVLEHQDFRDIAQRPLDEQVFEVAAIRSGLGTLNHEQPGHALQIAA
jgi:hypothetical protein